VQLVRETRCPLPLRPSLTLITTPRAAEDVNTNPIKIGATILVFALAMWLAMRNLQSDSGVTMAFFYDQSEKKIFTAPGDSSPPLAGVGGEPDDAVRAVLIAPRGMESNAAAREIAYLETFTPELKSMIEQRRAAIAQGQPAQDISDREFIARNTLVKLATPDAKWVPQNSPDGQTLTTAWLSKPTPGGKGWSVCKP